MKKSNLMKKDPIIKTVTEALADLPTPMSINYMWNMGFILGMTLMLQLLTGIVLSMSYVPHTSNAFESVIHIMRDIDKGWVMRVLHANGASLYFAAMYTHMSRGLFFDSPKKMPMVWISGMLILLASMGAAFMGYVLPWGQMSFWGATVITSMLSAIPYMGKEMTQWLWGNFSVSQPTLNRFFSLHFLLPMVVVALVLAHLILLHEKGSSNPLGLNPNLDKIKFYPHFLVKDLVPSLYLTLMMLVLVTQVPYILGDVENFSMASMESTPTHIQPEWYFLFAYAILRSIYSKLGGVMAMVMSIVMLVTPAMKSTKMSKKFKPTMKVMFWSFVGTVMILTWIGANPVEQPFVAIGQKATMMYFGLIVSL